MTSSTRPRCTKSTGYSSWRFKTLRSTSRSSAKTFKREASPSRQIWTRSTRTYSWTKLSEPCLINSFGSSSRSKRSAMPAHINSNSTLRSSKTRFNFYHVFSRAADSSSQQASPVIPISTTWASQRLVLNAGSKCLAIRPRLSRKHIWT